MPRATIEINHVRSQDTAGYSQAAVLENTRLNVSRAFAEEAVGALATAFWDSFKLPERPEGTEYDIGFAALRERRIGEFDIDFKWRSGERENY